MAFHKRLIMDYKALYNSKLTTAGELASCVQSGWNMVMDSYSSEPDSIVDAICERAKSYGLKNIKIQAMLEGYPLPFYTDESLKGIVTGVSWFSSGYARKAINAGLADFIPSYYRDIPGLIRRYYDYDAVLISVPPMDADGNFSLSCVGSYLEAAIEKSRRIFLEVNDCQPYVINAHKINIKDVDAIVVNNHPLPVFGETRLDATSETIGNIIAEQIPDGACIQLGIGAIPDAVGTALKAKHDLGIHTELFTDSMVQLIECGAVNNSKKQLHPGKTVAGIAFGSERIYKHIDNNPDIMIMPIDYVNNPDVICKNDNFISINAAIEVDFWGQVCSESIGTKHMSGSGGQIDYVRGACQSKGGKSFIAFTSTTKGISKIKSTLGEGAVVTTSKNDVDYIVTEYGLAHMRGEPLSSRTKQLIAIAHPDFRNELTFEAKKRGILI